MKRNTELKLQRLNNENKFKYFFCGLLLVVGLLLIVDITTTKAKYKVTQSIKLAEGKINFKPYDFKIMAMYQENDNGDYQEIEKMPSEGYVINEEKSYCTLDNKNKDPEAVLKTIDGIHSINNLSKNDKCFLYFDKYVLSAKDIILANKTISERTNFKDVFTTDTTDTIFEAQDDDGVTYYFAGNPTDNWIKFGGFYWRIIRINGDESIRLLYNGDNTLVSSDTSIISKSTYNSDYKSKHFLGYKYSANTGHGITTDSTIKTVVDLWYQTNLQSYSIYIDQNAGFCNDRSVASGDETSTSSTIYVGGRRYSNNAPSFRCNNEADLFTLANSTKGNKTLKYPIGLITYDEASYAGGAAYNKFTYITNNTTYYTMTPYDFNPSANYANIFVIGNPSAFPLPMASPLNNSYGVRPVINIRADVTLTGSGISSDPYKVS